MPNPPDSPLRERIKQRLEFYEDLGLGPFYRGRTSIATHDRTIAPALAASGLVPTLKQPSVPKTVLKTTAAPPAPASVLPKPLVPSVSSGPSLFDARIEGDSLLKIREDLGECTRCKLHRGRNKIVFGDGSPQSQLVFVG